jgi:hypothetical protein
MTAGVYPFTAAISVFSPNRLEAMADWDDVRRIALSLPETSEDQSRGQAHWKVRGKGFVWERPLRDTDLRALGDDAPEGPILGARVDGEIAKQALLASEPGVYFTTPHFDGYPAVLVRLGEISVDDLEELVVEAWMTKAPKRVAAAYLDARDCA